MKRFLALTLLLCVIGSVPISASGSILPSSGTLSWGYTRDLDTELTGMPSASGVWTLGSHFAIRSSATYFQKRTVQSVFSRIIPLTPGVETISTDRSDFVPLATGFRFYAGGTTEHIRGLFLDASPALFLARIPNVQGHHVLRAPLGVEFGAGIRVPAFDGSRVEVGLSYFHSKSSGSRRLVRPEETFQTDPFQTDPDDVQYPSLSFFALRVGVGWGD